MGGLVKNMGGSIKLLYITMFKIGKSCRKLIFGSVKHEKFSRCMDKTINILTFLFQCAWSRSIELFFLSSVYKLLQLQHEARKCYLSVLRAWHKRKSIINVSNTIVTCHNIFLRIMMLTCRGLEMLYGILELKGIKDHGLPHLWHQAIT